MLFASELADKTPNSNFGDVASFLVLLVCVTVAALIIVPLVVRVLSSSTKNREERRYHESYTDFR